MLPSGSAVMGGVGGNAVVGGGPAGPTEYLAARLTKSDRDEPEPEPLDLFKGFPCMAFVGKDTRWWPPIDPRSSKGAGGGAAFGTGRGGGKDEERGPLGPGSRFPTAYE